MLELSTGLPDYHKGSLILSDGIKSVVSTASWTVAERGWNQFMGHFRVQSQKHFRAQSQGPKLPHALFYAWRGKTPLGPLAYGAGSIQLPQKDFLNFFKFYLLLVARCLCCCMWAFSSCGEWELLSRCSAWVSHWGGFSCRIAWALGVWASVIVMHGLCCPEVCGIFPDQGLNPCLLNWLIHG